MEEEGKCWKVRVGHLNYDGRSSCLSRQPASSSQTLRRLPLEGSPQSAVISDVDVPTYIYVVNCEKTCQRRHNDVVTTRSPSPLSSFASDYDLSFDHIIPLKTYILFFLSLLFYAVASFAEAVRFLPVGAARLHLFCGPELHPDQPVCDVNFTHLPHLTIPSGHATRVQHSSVSPVPRAAAALVMGTLVPVPLLAQ